VAPRTQYTRVDGRSVAFQAFGSGQRELCLVLNYMSHLDWVWADPDVARMLRHAAARGRVAVYDRGGMLEEMDADRLRRMTKNARRLRDAGHLRAGVTLAHAADVLWSFSSPELYELLVLRRGWTAKRYGRFIADAMTQALL
jgi:hypothetical protein